MTKVYFDTEVRPQMRYLGRTLSGTLRFQNVQSGRCVLALYSPGRDENHTQVTLEMEKVTSPEPTLCMAL